MITLAILTAIENEILRVEGQLAELRRRVHATLDGSNAASALTPPASGPELPVSLTRSGAFHPRGYWYQGTFHRCSSYKEIYLGLLRALVTVQPDSAVRIAAELRLHGRTRRYLAQDPAQLFRGKTEQWAREHSERVANGWYADTNLSLTTMQSLMRRILNASGLSLGKDVVIVWDPRPASPSAPTMPRGTTH